MDISSISDDFYSASEVLREFSGQTKNLETIAIVGDLMSEAIRNGKKIIACGNGGSMSDAMHFAEELTGRFRKHRPSLPAIAISDPAYITCVANDYGFDFIFSRFVEGMGTEGDILLVISTSGNSVNIINATEAAIAKGLFVVALTGKDGGKLAQLAHHEIRVPHQGFSDRIQEVHIKIIHSLIRYIELKVFREQD